MVEQFGSGGTVPLGLRQRSVSLAGQPALKSRVLSKRLETTVSTRMLIGVSLIVGLAILVAGAVQLLMIVG